MGKQVDITGVRIEQDGPDLTVMFRREGREYELHSSLHCGKLEARRRLVLAIAEGLGIQFSIEMVETGGAMQERMAATWCVGLGPEQVSDTIALA